MSDLPVRVCFVCLGNICRSPTAEGVMRYLLEGADLTDRVEIDSAGTGAYHGGEQPDRRAAAACRQRGIVLEGASRQFRRNDFDRFDLVVAMDRDNEAHLLELAPDDGARARVHLLRSFHGRSLAAGDLDVPDPYYGGGDGFELVLDIVEDGCRGLLAHLHEEQLIT
ncbi:MAG: low molecular weight protein-tyrosine-phosphatase [Miltoncostaeaceae bacterium]